MCKTKLYKLEIRRKINKNRVLTQHKIQWMLHGLGFWVLSQTAQGIYIETQNCIIKELSF